MYAGRRTLRRQSGRAPARRSELAMAAPGESVPPEHDTLPFLPDVRTRSDRGQIGDADAPKIAGCPDRRAALHSPQPPRGPGYLPGLGLGIRPG